MIFYMIIRNGWIVSLLWVCASACSVQAISMTNRDATRTLPVHVATVYQSLPSATAYPTQTAYPTLLSIPYRDRLRYSNAY